MMTIEHEQEISISCKSLRFGDHQPKLNDKLILYEGCYETLKYGTLTLGPESGQ